MPSCLRLLEQDMRAAASRTFCTAGSSRPIRMAMMAITTSNSISVKPGRARRVFMVAIPQVRKTDEKRQRSNSLRPNWRGDTQTRRTILRRVCVPPARQSGTRQGESSEESKRRDRGREGGLWGGKASHIPQTRRSSLGVLVVRESKHLYVFFTVVTPLSLNKKKFYVFSHNSFPRSRRGKS